MDIGEDTYDVEDSRLYPTARYHSHLAPVRSNRNTPLQ